MHLCYTELAGQLRLRFKPFTTIQCPETATSYGKKFQSGKPCLVRALEQTSVACVYLGDAFAIVTIAVLMLPGITEITADLVRTSGSKCTLEETVVSYHLALAFRMMALTIY